MLLPEVQQAAASAPFRDRVVRDRLVDFREQLTGIVMARSVWSGGASAWTLVSFGTREISLLSRKCSSMPLPVLFVIVAHALEFLFLRLAASACTASTRFGWPRIDSTSFGLIPLPICSAISKRLFTTSMFSLVILRPAPAQSECGHRARKMEDQRSHSPITKSSEPRMATTSLIMWPGRIFGRMLRFTKRGRANLQPVRRAAAFAS